MIDKVRLFAGIGKEKTVTFLFRIFLIINCLDFKMVTF